MADPRDEASERLTRFRWRGQPDNTPVDFSNSRRSVDEAQWLNRAVPASLPNHFPMLAWVTVHPAEFRPVTTVGAYKSLCRAHMVPMANFSGDFHNLLADFGDSPQGRAFLDDARARFESFAGSSDLVDPIGSEPAVADDQDRGQ